MHVMETLEKSFPAARRLPGEDHLLPWAAGQRLYRYFGQHPRSDSKFSSTQARCFDASRVHRITGSHPLQGSRMRHAQKAITRPGAANSPKLRGTAIRWPHVRPLAVASQALSSDLRAATPTQPPIPRPAASAMNASAGHDVASASSPFTVFRSPPTPANTVPAAVDLTTLVWSGDDWPAQNLDSRLTRAASARRATLNCSL